jgi:nitroimidazol reductase NimA-like FMN-containing flavoprotein (pyridoxamine 5'-phosphate oxidase superfamily)
MVVEREPVTKLSPGFSSDAAVATEWSQARKDLEEAELYWLSTVRPSSRPHVTPLLGIWLDGAMYFCTGADERKAKNLDENPQCILTTGSNKLDGLDVVVEGEAATVSDEAELLAIADTYEAKYGARLTSREGEWFGLGDAMRNGEALVYKVVPSTAWGFAKGEVFSQTKWVFSPSP